MLSVFVKATHLEFHIMNTSMITLRLDIELNTLKGHYVISKPNNYMRN